MRFLSSIDQLRVDDQLVSALRHPADQDGAGVQLSTGLNGVRSSIAITKHSRARDHTQVLQPREAVNDRLGDTVAQIFLIRLASRIFEREHGNGIHELGRSRQYGRSYLRPRLY